MQNVIVDVSARIAKSDCGIVEMYLGSGEVVDLEMGVGLKCFVFLFLITGR